MFKISLNLYILSFLGLIAGQLQAQNFAIQRPYFEINGQKLDAPELGGLNAPQIQNIDLNLDGNPDLLVYEKNSGRIIPIIRFSDRYLVLPALLNFLPPISDWIICRDFNNDGKMDIFTSTPGGIALYENISTNFLDFRLHRDVITSESVFENISFEANIFVSSADIPLIDDLDGDGDLDILTFALGGNTIEHHKNISTEKTGSPGIDFKLVNTCYAYVSDDFTGTAFDLGQADCEGNVKNPEKRAKHAGFAFHYLPQPNRELLVGELTSGDLVKLQLGKSVSGGDSAISQIKQFPEGNAPDNLLFIQSNSGWFDLDNEKDLVLSSNTRGSASESSIYLYNEDGSALKTSSFLQNQSIDEGEHASPAFLDWDSDGDLDLVLSSAYRDGFLLPRLSFWENFGDASQPKYRRLKSFNGNFSFAAPLNLSINPSTQKVLLSNVEGSIREADFNDVMENGFDANFTILKNQNGDELNGGPGAYAHSIIGSDNNELLLGNTNGVIKKFTKENDAYLLDDDTYLDLNFKGNRLRQELSLSQTANELFVFTQSGEAYLFDISGNEPTEIFYENMIALTGVRGSATFIDVDGNGKKDIIVGIDDGGVLFFSEDLISSTNDGSTLEDQTVVVYPNPAESYVSIKSTTRFEHFEIYNSQGQCLQHGAFPANQTVLVDDLNPGMYILRLHGKTQIKTQKIWKK